MHFFLKYVKISIRRLLVIQLLVDKDTLDMINIEILCHFIMN